MVDWLLLAVYVGLGFTYKGAKYCAFAFTCVMVAQLLPFDSPVFMFHAYAAFCFAYLFVCTKLVKIKSNLALVFAVFALAVYDCVYAIDCVTNPTAKTWLYRNHENIIILIHSAIVLLLIQKSNGVVVAFCYNNINAVRDSLRIRFNHSRMARETREKVHK